MEDNENRFQGKGTIDGKTFYDVFPWT